MFPDVVADRFRPVVVVVEVEVQVVGLEAEHGSEWRRVGGKPAVRVLVSAGGEGSGCASAH